MLGGVTNMQGNNIIFESADITIIGEVIPAYYNTVQESSSEGIRHFIIIVPAL
jgi:hypothetical protein